MNREERLLLSKKLLPKKLLPKKLLPKKLLSKTFLSKNFAFIIAACLFLHFSTTFAACAVTDDAGNTLVFKQPAQRIISLAPDITENLFVVGAGKNIVGVMQGSDYPAAAKKLPLIGSYNGIDLEKTLALHPDLIVVWGNTFARQLAVIKHFGIPIYTANPRDLNDVPRTLRHLGCLTGKQVLANQQANIFLQREMLLRKQFQTQPTLTLFYQIGSYSLITINKNSWINQVITLCGGRNIFANAKLSAPEVTWESVLTANPQVIISDATTPAWKNTWQKWPGVKAVKNNALYSVNPDLLERASPRLLDGALQVCTALAMARLREQKLIH